MSEDIPATRLVSVPSHNDVELDVLALCLKALSQCPDINTKARVAEYLASRYQPVAARGGVASHDE